MRKAPGVGTSGAVGLALLGLLLGVAQAAPRVSATASASTASGTDDADDPCIWIAPDDPARSLVIGTDKHFGLHVYDLAGNELQTIDDGGANNADLRYGFVLGGQQVDLVAASNRSDDSMSVYAIDPGSRELQDVGVRKRMGIAVYGACMYHSRASGKLYFIVNSKSGEVEQWELLDDGQGRVDATLARSFDVGSQTEGCVADDELGWLYIGEEGEAIRRYGAEPADGEGRTEVDSTAGRLTADVEGLTIYYGTGGEGYLIASNQGASSFMVYRRGGANAFVGEFEVSGASSTDGLDVTSVALGPAFVGGLLVVHDGGGGYLLVPWDDLARALSPPLRVDTGWDPRGATGAPAADASPPASDSGKDAGTDGGLPARGEDGGAGGPPPAADAGLSSDPGSDRGPLPGRADPATGASSECSTALDCPDNQVCTTAGICRLDQGRPIEGCQLGSEGSPDLLLLWLGAMVLSLPWWRRR